MDKDKLHKELKKIMMNKTFANALIVLLMIAFLWLAMSANAKISSGLPMRMMSAISSARDLSAAVRVRSSSDSGSTMRCLFAFARAMMLSMSVMILNMFNCYFYLTDSAKLSNFNDSS